MRFRLLIVVMWDLELHRPDAPGARPDALGVAP
jgi:hypothetical protein